MKFDKLPRGFQLEIEGVLANVAENLGPKALIYMPRSLSEDEVFGKQPLIDALIDDTEIVGEECSFLRKHLEYGIVIYPNLRSRLQWLDFERLEFSYAEVFWLWYVTEYLAVSNESIRGILRSTTRHYKILVPQVSTNENPIRDLYKKLEGFLARIP